MTKYYHGGRRGLTHLLPPSETGQRCANDYFNKNPMLARRDRVYITTDMHCAMLFAAFDPSGKGIVYEVEPIGDVEIDPDYLGEDKISFQCAEARIIRVAHKPTGLMLKKIRKDMLRG